MRRMTCCATLGLDGRMLIDEWASGFGMAFHTNRIAGNAAMQLLLLECSMRVVTITATDQALVHLMVKGLRKGGLDIRVTGITELRLRYLQQMFLTLKRVDAVAACTSYLCCPVRGTLKIGMRSCMAAKTLLVH